MQDESTIISNLTDEERDKLANEELEKVYQWDDEESKKARKKLEEKGVVFVGLDGSYPELKAITKEAKRRVRELQKKYYPEKFK